MCQWKGCLSLCYNSANDFIFGVKKTQQHSVALSQRCLLKDAESKLPKVQRGALKGQIEIKGEPYKLKRLNLHK